MFYLDDGKQSGISPKSKKPQTTQEPAFSKPKTNQHKLSSSLPHDPTPSPINTHSPISSPRRTGGELNRTHPVYHVNVRLSPDKLKPAPPPTSSTSSTPRSRSPRDVSENLAPKYKHVAPKVAENNLQNQSVIKPSNNGEDMLDNSKVSRQNSIHNSRNSSAQQQQQHSPRVQVHRRFASDKESSDDDSAQIQNGVRPRIYNRQAGSDDSSANSVTDSQLSSDEYSSSQESVAEEQML